MIHIIVTVLLPCFLLVASRKSKFEFELKHCTFLKKMYKVFIPVAKKLNRFTNPDNRLFLLYTSYEPEHVLCAHAAVKMCIFCLMLLLPVNMMIAKASVTFIFISFVLCFVTPALADYDIKKEYEKQLSVILDDFSGFITKFTLYIGSGMSLYQAFMHKEYDLNPGLFKDKLTETKNSIYLKSDPENAFLELSMNLPVTQINAFCSIMISAFKNTEAGIKETLKTYTSSIWIERKNRAKIKAEQATAKAVPALAVGLMGILLVLIAPAMLMLSGM